jgi:hypothetical protein
VAQDLEEQQRTGAIRADGPADHLARVLLAVLDGLQNQWMHDPAVDIAAIAETFTRMLAGPADPAQEAKPAE